MKKDFIDDFLLENYLNLGTRKCKKFLGISESTINSRSKKLGLRISKEKMSEIRREAALELNKSKTQNTLDQFSKIDNPYTAYILGYLWADGYASKYSIVMGISSSDFNEVKDIFLKTGLWKFTESINRVGNKITTIRTCNTRLSEHLGSLGFYRKSGGSMEAILNFIPNHLKPYWVRGFFDGDGCCSFSLGKERVYRFSLSIASTADQDWQELVSLLKKEGCEMKIRIGSGNYEYKGEKKKSSYSVLYALNREQIFNFFNYIYHPSLERFGLKRKYNKFIDIFTQKMQRKLKKNSFMEENNFEYWL